MKIFIKSFYLTITLAVLLGLPAWAQQNFDLHKMLKKGEIKSFNRELTAFKDGARAGIRLSKDEGEGVAWIEGLDFTNGTIEFDVRGENVKQHSFVGLAFHRKDNATFDAVYFRPFNFLEQNPAAVSHQVQYISLPEYPWRTLREKFPDAYEDEIFPKPNPDDWFHARIVVDGKKISVYVNNNTKACMEIDKLTAQMSGAIGFYAADTSGGDFANLTVTKSK